MRYRHDILEFTSHPATKDFMIASEDLVAAWQELHAAQRGWHPKLTPHDVETNGTVQEIAVYRFDGALRAFRMTERLLNKAQRAHDRASRIDWADQALWRIRCRLRLILENWRDARDYARQSHAA